MPYSDGVFKEPWSVTDLRRHYDAAEVAGKNKPIPEITRADGGTVFSANTKGPYSPELYERVCACVNALAGVSTEAIKAGMIAHLLNAAHRAGAACPLTECDGYSWDIDACINKAAQLSQVSQRPATNQP